MPATERPTTVEALLADGTTAAIRRLGPADRDAVFGLYTTHLSADSLRLRFFGASRRAPALAADRLCAPPRPDLIGLGAWVDGELVGEADCELVDPAAGDAELALAVADAWQHRGVATLLIEHLAHAARDRGIAALVADTLAENRAVHQVLTDLGLPVHRRFRQGEVLVRVPLDENDPHYRDAVETRGRAAGIASLAALLRPRAVAVVGASRRPGSVGQAVLRKIRQNGFTGPVWAVNPHAATVAGEPAHASVAALPGVPDLAVLAVPPAAVPGAAEECGLAGVRALVVLTSGLTADQGRRLLHACRRHSMRMVGPNSLGIAHTDPAVRLDAEFGGAHPLPGTAAVAVQSGGVGIALMERLAWLGTGVSAFVSLGDKYDVSGNDLLQWWEADGRTDLVLLHLESFGNPRAFARTARRVTRTIPVLTVDAGRSAAGRRGAASHTAAAATPTVTRQALFRQAGITATRSIAELVDTAALLRAQPLPGARGSVAVVSNAGGIGILAADACTEAGLHVPALPDDLARALREVLPAAAATANPVDTTAAATPAELRACIDLLADHPAVDALLVCLVPTALVDRPDRAPLQALVDGPAHRRVPIAAVLLDQETPVRHLAAHHGLLPSYADPAAAAHALAHAVDRARHLARPDTPVAVPATADTGTARGLVDAFLAERPDGGWLDPARTADLLGCYGLPLTTTLWERDEPGILAAARTLCGTGHDGQVVLKAYWPDQVHKSAAGAVRTGLRTDDDVRDALHDLRGRLGDRMAGAVVQPMAAPGLELLAGVVQDEVFGPLVVLGLGGTATEALDDRCARLAPLTELDHDYLPAELRAAPLLRGAAGDPPVDRGALHQVLAGLSRLALDLPQLAEAELNPLIAGRGGRTAVDARVRLEPRTAFDPHLRQLRRWPGTDAP
ncbi:GNAT family N-acetyltransferase [Kitasatospora sp. NPDC059571]|uniref:bifunctional acetate--CoA ligase family protein/GNAT family N-acetyltransferase n=1 Tax=Kitasatospora sp. NPDC059571 TaxID=3346871 RepID=UPI0036936522